MGQVILLSLTASLNPTLVAATTVMLLLDSPAKLMPGYLAGALMTSITLGLIIVFSLSDSSATDTTENTLSPVADIALGALALLVAWVLWTGRHERFTERRRTRQAAKAAKDPPRWRQELSKGSARTTFVIGALLTFPGASYLAGLRHIHQLNYSTPVTVLVVLGFNLVMLWLLEVPLACFLIAPKMDTRRRRADQNLGQPPRARIRRARTRRARRPTHHQRHRGAGHLRRSTLPTRPLRHQPDRSLEQVA